MNGLFLKIFGWFWLTTLVTITATYWISSQISDNDYRNTHLDRMIEHYIEEIENQISRQTLSEFQHWLGNQRFPPGFGVVLTDESGSILASHGLPAAAINFYAQNRTWPFRAGKHFRIEQKWLATEQKLQLSLLLLPRKPGMASDHPHSWLENLNKRTRGWGVFRLLIALSVSAIVCYLLARYLAKPITSLRNTVRKLGIGNFETDIASKFANRNDEISELAIDIDEMAAKLREQFRRREDLLRDISHELRSPLARMRIATELIKSKTSEYGRKEVAQLESDIALIDQLIGEILTFSRLSDENRRLNFTGIDVRELLIEIIKNANFEAKPNGKEVVLRCADETRYRLYADEALIQRALENIIRNAVRYTRPKTEVTVELQRDTTLLTVKIIDCGPGVAEDQLERIFQPFYRVSDSRGRESGGSGLGLAISRRAVELHKGRIFAGNSRAGGLIITIELPADQHAGDAR